MQLVPVPTTHHHLTATLPLWAPFLGDIAKRSIYTVQELLQQLHDHEVQPILALDAGHAVALMGIMICDDDGDRVAELVWLTGKRRESWQPLMGELERYLREHLQCVKCRPVCRPGWQRFLLQHGYRLIGPLNKPGRAHIIMEKVL